MIKHALADDRIFVIRDFLTPEECDELIARSEAVGYGDAPIMTPGGPVIYKGMRNNERVMIDDVALASWLWERAAPLIPPEIEGWEVIGLNERFRFYRYDPGQRFLIHIDGYFARSEEERSRLTFMVYLNDDFEGGETAFFSGEGIHIQDWLSVQPERGAALVFDHIILHEGAAVRSGQKYVLRSDVMYRRRVPLYNM